MADVWVCDFCVLSLCTSSNMDTNSISCMDWLVCSFQFPVFSYSTCYSHRGLFSRDLMFAFVFLMTNVYLSFRLLSSSSRCPRGDGLGEEQLSHPEKRKPSRGRNRNKCESFAKVWCQRLSRAHPRNVPLFSEKDAARCVSTSRH